MQNKKAYPKLLVGVTGGIGSGKSVVCSYLAKLGSEVFYADTIAKELYFTNESLKKALIRQFGDKILDTRRNISFENFRRKVFASDSNQKRVNKIVHPFVIKEIIKRTRNSRSKTIYIEAALIFESGFNRYLDYTIEVYAPIKKRIEWLCKSRKLKSSQIRSIINFQMPEKEKLLRADFIIRNNKSINELIKNVKFIYTLFN